MKIELKNMKHVYPTGDEALKGINLVIEGTEPVAISVRMVQARPL